MKFLKSIIKKIRLKNTYPDVLFRTLKVGLNCQIGFKAALMHNVEVRDKVKIGSYSYVNQDSIIVSGVIGNFCSIGYRCQIGMFEHPVNHISTSPWIFKENKSLLGLNTFSEIHSPPIIGNDVWIGSNSIILQGVEIGDGSIIAAGSVVTKDVAPYSVVGGVPAKLIKYRFNEEEIEFLKNLKWFNLPESELNNYKYLFKKKEFWYTNIKTGIKNEK